MTTLTTHWPCPVDGSPCWRERECPHAGDDGVRACVKALLEQDIKDHAPLWAAMAKE